MEDIEGIKVIVQPTPAPKPNQRTSSEEVECRHRTDDIVGAPRQQLPLQDRLTQPYMGVYNERQWDKNGIVGRFMGPLEELYFDFIPHEDLVKRINENRNRLITRRR